MSFDSCANSYPQFVNIIALNNNLFMDELNLISLAPKIVATTS